jgi:putative ABC transport system permease protein
MSAFGILASSARRRLGDSLLLAISTSFAVMALGTFVAAAASPTVTAAAAAKESLAQLFTSAAVVTALFAILSGWFFAEHYLARRKREIATWLLVGMKKKTAFLLLAGEFAVAGLFAFLAGSGLGLLLSRFFALALAALMKEREPVAMAFGLPSLAAAGGACFLQFILACSRSGMVVSRVSLASLMRSEREAERPPKSRPLLAALGAILVLGSYAAAVFSKIEAAVMLMLPVLVCTIAGTFLCFGALVPSLAASLRKRKMGAGAGNIDAVGIRGGSIDAVGIRGGSIDAEGTRGGNIDAAGLVAAAQIGFRSRRNARLLALTAVLVAVAATASGTVLALHENDSYVLRRVCPHAIELASPTQGSIEAVNAALIAAGEGSPSPATAEYLEGWLERPNGDKYDVKLFPRKDWAEAVGKLGEQAGSIEEGRFSVALSSYYITGKNGEAAMRLGVEKTEIALRPYREDGSPAVSTVLAGPALIISDADYARLAAAATPSARKAVAYWDGLDPDKVKAALPALGEIVPRAPRVRIAILAAQDSESGAMLFVGIFLAAVFILAAACLLSFRVIEDSRDDAERYRILSELGASRGVVRRSLVIQDLFSFGLPLLFGLAHCTAALVMMRTISGYSNLKPTLIVALSAIPIFAVAAAFAVDRQLSSCFTSIERTTKE